MERLKEQLQKMAKVTLNEYRKNQAEETYNSMVEYMIEKARAGLFYYTFDRDKFYWLYAKEREGGEAIRQIITNKLKEQGLYLTLSKNADSEECYCIDITPEDEV